MIDLVSTAHEFSLLNGLGRTVGALPSLFNSLNGLAATAGIPGFTTTHEAPIETLGEASAAWLTVASALTRLTQIQADVCSRLKKSEADWLAEFDLKGSGGAPYSPRQLDLHDQLMSHGLLVHTFVPGFIHLIEDLDIWVAKAIPTFSLLSVYMQHWHDTVAVCDPRVLERLSWQALLLSMNQTAIDLDPTAGEWLPYKDFRQALTAVRRAGHMLLIAPVTAAQHATRDLGMLAEVLKDSADQLKTMQPEQTPSVYQRHLRFAVLSCDSARLHCESLLALLDKNGAK
jgi:hypothetical protein